jgi:hypothetical protein
MKALLRARGRAIPAIPARAFASKALIMAGWFNCRRFLDEKPIPWLAAHLDDDSSTIGGSTRMSHSTSEGLIKRCRSLGVLFPFDFRETLFIARNRSLSAYN